MKLHQKTNELGRSMVEMLGVLAVIGVLSLGGIWMYDVAANMYQTNQIQKTILSAKTMADVNISPQHQIEVNRFVKTTLMKYQEKPETPMVELSDAIDKYVITLHEINPKIQKSLLNQTDVYTSHHITVKPLAENKLQFIFDGHPCQEPKVWNGKECSCPNEYEYGDDCEECLPPRMWRYGECVCPKETPVWHEENCVECVVNTDCIDNSKPTCGADNICEPCPDSKPVYNTTKNECEPCPTNRYWNGTECSVNECEDSADCQEKYEDDTYFCTRGGNPCDTTTFTGAVCKKINYKTFEINGVNFYLSADDYNQGSQGWESSINFCLALEKQMVSIADLACTNEVKIGAWDRSCTADTYTIHSTLRNKVQSVGITLAPWIAFDAWTESGPSTCNKTCMPITETRLNTHQSPSQHGGPHYVLCRDWGPMCYGTSKRVGDECKCEGGRIYQNKDCVCPAEKPLWDAEKGKCVASYECKGTIYECQTNNDCDSGYYCDIECYTEYCKTNTTGIGGSCRKASDDIKIPNAGTNPPFTMSNRAMYWWSAKNFCESLGESLTEVSDYDCTTPTICASGCDAVTGFCRTENNLPENIVVLQKAYEQFWFWTNTDYDDCNAYNISTVYGYVNYLRDSNLGGVICKKR